MVSRAVSRLSVPVFPAMVVQQVPDRAGRRIARVQAFIQGRERDERLP